MSHRDGVWRIELLAELRAVRGEWVVSRFRTQKMAALLGHLAFFRDRSHPRELLAEMLWPDGSLDSGRNNLSQALSWLRHQLEPPGVAPGSVILARRMTVQLNPETVVTDVAELRETLERAERAPAEERRAHLETALTLYRGDLLPGLHQTWITPERDRLKRASVRVACDLARESEERGDLAAAEDLLHRAAVFDPLAEDAHRALLRVLAARGNPAAALRHKREIERAFERELGRGLSAATLDLARSIEREAAAASPLATAPTPVAPTETALDRPVGIVTALLADAPSGRALVERHGGVSAERPGGLVASFSLPGDALACALAMERAGACRIALDTGKGDVAARATRLFGAARSGQVLCSEETAVFLRRDLESGVRLADLGVFKLDAGAAPERLFQIHREGEAPAAPDAERVYASTLPLEASPFHGRADEIARLVSELVPGRRGLVTLMGPGGIGKTRLALEVARRLLDPFKGEVWFVPLASVSNERLVPDAIASALRLSPGPGDPIDRVAERLGRSSALLVLDNFEQVAAGGARHVKALLERTPGLSCLVTSRQRLGLEGEREVDVAPLPVPGPETPEGLAELASVQMFVDRARAVRPAFELTATNAPGIAELVRRLEGIPLALALAAGRLQVLSPEQILARLRDRLDLLASRSGDVPERHRTLRAAIDGSVKLLGPERQRFFARLSVFRGGFTLEAAETVCDEPLAIDAVAELRECSLLSVSGDEPRFSMLETVREYAEELLAPEERESLVGRHASYFASLVERAAPHIRGSWAVQWLDRLEAEQGNFRLAIESGPSGETALKIAGGLRHHWSVRGPNAEGRRLLAVGLERCRDRTVARFEALMGSGGLAFAGGDSDAARTAWRESLELARELDHRSGISRALNNLGLVAEKCGDLLQARSLLEESAALARQLDDKVFTARVVVNLANLASTLGDASRSRALLAEGAALSASVGDRLNEAIAKNFLADACEESGDIDGATRNLSEANAAFEAIGAREGVALTLCALARIDRRQGNVGRGRERLERSLAILREIGTRLNLHIVLLELAVQTEDRARASALLDEALGVVRASGDRVAVMNVLTAQADLVRDDPGSAARALYVESLSLARATGARRAAVSPLVGLAILDARSGDHARSARLLGAVRALNDELGIVGSEDGDDGGRALDAARAALGSGFEEAWEAGRRLSWDQAIELATAKPHP